MTTVEDVLRMYGDGIGVADFADQLAESMRGKTAPDSRALSAHDRQVLGRIGVPAADLTGQPLPAGRAVVDAAADLLVANAAMLPVADVAARLGRSVVRVRGAIADGSLYGVKVGRSWLLPQWQFTDAAAPIPHLRKIIAGIPPGTSAPALQRVMTEPDDELFLDGHPVSPRDWLIAGQFAAPVVQLIEQLYAW